jgi:hypothetical protein
MLTNHLYSQQAELSPKLKSALVQSIQSKLNTVQTFKYFSLQSIQSNLNTVQNFSLFLFNPFWASSAQSKTPVSFSPVYSKQFKLRLKLYSLLLSCLFRAIWTQSKTSQVCFSLIYSEQLSPVLHFTDCFSPVYSEQFEPRTKLHSLFLTNLFRAIWTQS